MLAKRRVKIVGTIGPASSNKEVLKGLICAGLNVVRLNFSHGSHEDHEKVIHMIRELSSELNTQVAILQDLQGPKIRLGKMQEGGVEVKSGDHIQITTESIVGNNKRIPTDFSSLPSDCKPGTRILIDDGLLEFEVLQSDGDTNIDCKVIYGGTVKDRKGLNIPGANLSVDCLTEKDLQDLEFGLDRKVDYIALSFVRAYQDMERLRKLVQKKSPETRLVAKIEMLEAIEDLVAIVKHSDAVMVARGDLAIEVGQSSLPGLQKRIIKEANRFYKPVITATQMLDSMVKNPRPTRAEVTDVANAMLDGSDALMLSAESASGQYPVKCIETLHEIALEVERSSQSYYKFPESRRYKTTPEAIAESTCLAAYKLSAKAIVCLTTSGKTATIIASMRPEVPIIAVTHVDETLRRLEMVWGIQPIKVNRYTTGEEAMQMAEAMLLKYGVVQEGDRVVLSLGYPVADHAKTNALRIHTIGNNDRLDEIPVPLRFS